MKLRVDHVTLGASRLEALASAFAAVGLAADYGGLHSNGVTHMSQVAFDDGSYVELVSVLRPGQPSPWWQEHIVHEGGPCAWAVRVTDVDAEVQRLRARGVTVGDATHMQRKPPGGQTVEWDLAFVGELGAGAMQPFIIKDRTPRELRVPASKSIAGSELSGVHRVVLGVEDVAVASALFQDAYDLPPAERLSAEQGELNMALFPGEPLILISPSTQDGWLAERLAQFGPTPCAFLLGSRDLDASRERSRLGEVQRWGDLSVAWFDGDPLLGRWLGVVAV
ncbi:MAG: VOC family protein [Gammaproteobacteria bacterium]|nr:MAG: VOC family protein [Gammaproteobacteria bacterium]